MDQSGQMTIFDYFSELDSIPEEEMARQVGEAVGMVFKRVVAEWFEESEGRGWFETRKSKNEKYDLYYSTYLGTNKRFIGAGWQYKTSAGGGPCDTIQEAIDFIKRGMVKAQQEKERLKKVAEQEREYRRKYNLDY